MTTAEIITNMLNQMTDLEAAGCKVVITDEGVRELFEIYKLNGLRELSEKTQCLLAGTEEKNVWIRIPGPDGKTSLYDDVFPVTKIGRTADIVNRQAGFILSHPEMFAGCEIDL